MTTPPAVPPAIPRRHVYPLYAAGFTTAFGAHAVAANLGGYSLAHGQSLLLLGVMLALYDGAEVLLKPVFGTLSDRVGARPVLLGGLAAFAVFSAAFVLARIRGGCGLPDSDRALPHRRSPRPHRRWGPG